MPRAYSVPSQPQDLSTTANLVQRLRHPLRIKRFRDSLSQLPQSSTTGERQYGNQRSVEDEQTPAPSPQDSLQKLSKIVDNGEYTEQRYSSTDVYWNSVMSEAREDAEVHQTTTRKGKGKGKSKVKEKTERHHILANTEQLYKTYRQRLDQRRHDAAPKLPQQTTFFVDSLFSNSDKPDHPSTTPIPFTNTSGHISTPSIPRTSTTPTHESKNSNEDPATPLLTWNYALTFILNSKAMDPELSQTIKARAGNPDVSGDGGEGEEVDMCTVALVPNFSFPIQGSRWADAWGAAEGGLDGEVEEMEGEDEESGAGEQSAGEEGCDGLDVGDQEGGSVGERSVEALCSEPMPVHRSSGL